MRKLLSIILLCLTASILFAQHLKKDGTPDRRYKGNKTYSASSSSSSTVHLKKDGTPDRRYKQNRTYFSTPSTSASPTYKYYTSTRKNKTIYFYSIKRDANGRIHRSSSARNTFMKMTGFPHGRPGYVVDHVIALKRGGCDCPSNMQWQTIADAKEKDKTEVPVP
ncbi:MAG: HNH endonuclease signature motif containing protein [Chitinophagales bacterium]